MQTGPRYAPPFMLRQPMVGPTVQTVPHYVYVRPRVPKQFAPYYTAPPRRFDNTQKQFSEESPATPRDINTNIDDLPEAPTNTSKKFLRNGLLALLITAVVLGAALVPSLVINLGLSTTTITTTTTTTETSTTTSSKTSSTTSSTTSTTTTAITCIPSCVNGNCTAMNVCTCFTGWYGSRCSLANCTNPCQNGGTCSSPNTCTCTSQWNGTTCTIPICTSPCLNNGTCAAPNVCNCTSSWNGSLCQTPVCNPACTNGGNCTAPNTCTCDTDMWIGPICQTPVRIFWNFDGTLQDLYNNFNGISTNGPTYVSPGYNGAGSCLWLNKSLSQSATINTPPFLNMAYTSFTLEVWVYAQTFCNNSGCSDNAVFGQFEQNILDHSLHIIVRNQRIYLGFFSDDVSGNQTLYPGQWYHMAYVYDYSTLTQYVYVNGYMDVSRGAAGPYQGTTGALTIGTNGVNTPNNFFDGCLDSIAYFGRAKNATEVLNDATLVAYLPFDVNTLIDSGPLGINGTGTNYSYTTSGRLNKGLSLSGLSSYVQITGLRRIGLNSWSYSVAVWIKPTSLAGGTIMHLSSRTDGAQTNAWCLPIMGLTSSGQIAINSWNGSGVPLTGPSITLNSWTHVVATYSSTNGERLYVNGTLRASTGAYNFMAGNTLMTITLGSSLLGIGACNTGTIQMGQFYGYLDEFYVYARELTVSEVTALNNV